MLYDDIIRLICAEILDGPGDYLAIQSNLLSLGLASRMFLNPALDALWNRLESIEPLLLVLPETALVNGKKMFLRPIAPSSWVRLHFYTSRVREFCSDWELPAVHDSVYAYLCQGRPIFPKLRTLELHHHLCTSDSVTLFLTPSLRVVSWPMEEGDASSDLGPSLAVLVSKSPRLRSLTLTEYTYSGLSLSLRRLCALEYLSARCPYDLEVNFVQAIAVLPKLTNLDLTLPAGVLDYTGVESGFPSLTKIVLRGSSSDTRRFLAVARPPLQALFIDWTFDPVMDQSPGQADIAAITHLLPSFPFLRELLIDGEALLLLPTDLDELQLWSIFEPLLELKRLEYLFYQIPLPVSDQKTVRIASAFPHLKGLCLYHSAGGLSSLESLAHFARHCPDLKTLRYPIELQTANPSTMFPRTLSPHPLHTFETKGEPSVMNAPAIALGLYQIFPNLVVVGGWDVAIGGNSSWRLVNEILRNRNRHLEK